jgi:drug/metabolite transporter (DMT)-like permease
MFDALPAAPVVLHGLAAALTWGAADFGGGLASRRAPLIGVTLFVQAIGVVIALGLWAVRGEAVPGPADIAWAAIAGVFGAVGIAGLYRSLAVGPMSIVAPVIGVIGASLPVIVGFALEGLPRPIVVAGIGLAIVAVVLVSRAADAGSPGGRTGLAYALAAGIGIGLFSVAISRVGEGLVFGPLIVVRAVATAIFVGLVLFAHQRWRILRPTWRLVAVVALLDLLGNASFVAATQAGELAVASILGSLYPVSTVLLAAFVLRERISRSHAAGIVVAGVAIACIAGGSA